MSLTLQNPHSVLAALDARPRDLVEVRLGSQNPSPGWSEVADRARTLRIPVSNTRAEAPGRRGNSKREIDTGRGGASAAVVRERSDVSLEELFAGGSQGSSETSCPGFSEIPGNFSRPPHPLYLALDCLQDPHNVGAIFRTAAFFGVAGIVVTRDRSAPLNATVYDVASGGLEVVPFSVQTNLRRSLDVAKERGVWVLGTSEHAETDYAAVPLDRPWMLVVGNEESGMRRLTTEHCDLTCRIAPRTAVGSLNVSVATGILIARFAGAGARRTL